MNLFVRTSLLILFSNLMLVAAPKRPAWVDSPPYAPHLFQGFGVADETGSKEADRLKADQNARTEIIQEISSTISSSISSFYEESIQNDDPGESRATEVYTSLSSIYADGTIEGIQIVDRYYDKKTGTYYSHATLLRSEFETQMSRRATEAQLFAKGLFQQAQTVLNDGDVSSALNSLNKALSQVLVAQAIIKKQLQFDLDDDGNPNFLDAMLSQSMRSLLNDVNFVILSGEGQKGERNQALSGPMEGQILYSQNGNSIPVKYAALSVNLEGAEADHAPVITTGDDGSFTLRIDKILSASSPNPKVKVNFYLPQLDMYYKSQVVDLMEILPSGLEFSFRIDVAASVKIFVRVLEEIEGALQRNSKSDGILTKALLSQDYTIIDPLKIQHSVSLLDLDESLYDEDYRGLPELLGSHANYAIVGLISSRTSATGTVNYARSTAKLKVIDLGNGRVIAVGNKSNVKAGGNTTEKANSSALKKSSYSAIAELLVGLNTALE